MSAETQSKLGAPRRKQPLSITTTLPARLAAPRAGGTNPPPETAPSPRCSGLLASPGGAAGLPAARTGPAAGATPGRAGRQVGRERRPRGARLTALSLRARIRPRSLAQHVDPADIPLLTADAQTLGSASNGCAEQQVAATFSARACRVRPSQLGDARARLELGEPGARKRLDKRANARSLALSPACLPAHEPS